VRSLLRGAGNDGYLHLPNRVVRTDGGLADLPERSDQQRRQLLAEGIPFTADSREDFGRISPVTLT
jgi:alkylated DNA nucleotide flippase Atl1